MFLYIFLNRQINKNAPECSRYLYISIFFENLRAVSQKFEIYKTVGIYSIIVDIFISVK